MTNRSTLEDQAVPLSEVITAAAERIHYAEGRRTNFTVVAGALLAGGVAILTFIPDKRLSHALTDAALGASIGSIALGLLLLIVFARQTNRYPWTAATNTWKWFYRDALPDQEEFNWTWRDILQPHAEKKRLQTAFEKQLPLFVSKVETLKDRKTSFDQDVQQLYVLHINDKFKNVHLSQLRTILSSGLMVIAVVSVISGLWGWYTDERRTVLHVAQVREGPVELRTRWRFVSSSDDTGLVLAAVTIKNYGPKPVQLPRWTFVDAHGAPVPAVMSAATIDAAEVPPRSSARYSIFIKPAEPTYVEGLIARIP